MQHINNTPADSGLGDTLKVAFDKVNANFAELVAIDSSFADDINAINALINGGTDTLDHNHTISQIQGLQAALNSKVSTTTFNSQILAINASIQAINSSLSDIIVILNSKIEEAPFSGITYGRKDGAWVEVTGSASGDFVPYTGATKDVFLGPYRIDSSLGFTLKNYTYPNYGALEYNGQYANLYAVAQSDEFGNSTFVTNPEEGFVSYFYNGSRTSRLGNTLLGISMGVESGTTSNHLTFNEDGLFSDKGYTVEDGTNIFYGGTPYGTSGNKQFKFFARGDGSEFSDLTHVLLSSNVEEGNSMIYQDELNGVTNSLSVGSSVNISSNYQSDLNQIYINPDNTTFSRIIYGTEGYASEWASGHLYAGTDYDGATRKFDFFDQGPYQYPTQRVNILADVDEGVQMQNSGEDSLGNFYGSTFAILTNGTSINVASSGISNSVLFDANQSFSTKKFITNEGFEGHYVNFYDEANNVYGAKLTYNYGSYNFKTSLGEQVSTMYRGFFGFTNENNKTSYFGNSSVTNDNIVLNFPNKISGQYTIATTSDLDNYLPFSGGTLTGGLTGTTVKANRIAFNTGLTQTANVGELVWNDTDGTLDLGMKGGNVTLQIGQEQLVRVVNKTGGALTEAGYQAVYVSGAQGQRLKVDLAKADSDLTSAGTLGIVTENIAVNQEGFITTGGLVRNINTTGSLQGETWADGQLLYLSPTTAGRITNVKPQAPQHTVVVGYVVYAHATQGTIYVKVDNGYELDELHDVKISGVTNNQVLTYESSTGLWKNKDLPTQITFNQIQRIAFLTI